MKRPGWSSIPGAETNVPADFQGRDDFVVHLICRVSMAALWQSTSRESGLRAAQWTGGSRTLWVDDGEAMRGICRLCGSCQSEGRGRVAGGIAISPEVVALGSAKSCETKPNRIGH